MCVWIQLSIFSIIFSRSCFAFSDFLRTATLPANEPTLHESPAILKPITRRLRAHLCKLHAQKTNRVSSPSTNRRHTATSLEYIIEPSHFHRDPINPSFADYNRIIGRRVVKTLSVSNEPRLMSERNYSRASHVLRPFYRR